MVKIEETELLNRAEIEEKNYNWEQAAKLYEQAARAVLDQNKLKNAAKIYYKLGDIYLHIVLASDTKEDYLSWNEQSVKAFHEAESLFNYSNDKLLSMECKAKAFNAMSYVITSVEETKKNLTKSINIFLELNKNYSKANNNKNCVRLSTLTIDSIISFMVLCNDPSELDFYSQMANKLIETAWILLNEIDDINFRALLLYDEAMLLNFNRWTELIYGDEKQEEIRKIFLKRCEETLILAEDCNDFITLGSIFATTGFFYCIV